MKNERTVKDENYYAIFGWMTNPKKMGLTGLELQVFAIVYGFCQAQPLNGYFASTSYLAEFTGATARGIRKALDGLIQKGYIIREAQEKYNTFKYIAIVPDFDETPPKQGSGDNGNTVPEGEQSSSDAEQSSPDAEQSSPDAEQSSSDAEQSSTNNIYINNKNHVLKEKNKKENMNSISFCSFSDAPNVQLTTSEFIYLTRYYGQALTNKYITKLQKELSAGKVFKSHLDIIEKRMYEDNTALGEQP